jgi:hypothetical protein
LPSYQMRMASIYGDSDTAHHSKMPVARPSSRGHFGMTATSVLKSGLTIKFTSFSVPIGQIWSSFQPSLLHNINFIYPESKSLSLRVSLLYKSHFSVLTSSLSPLSGHLTAFVEDFDIIRCCRLPPYTSSRSGGSIVRFLTHCFRLDVSPLGHPTAFMGDFDVVSIHPCKFDSP